MCFFRKLRERKKEKEERSRNSTLTIGENDEGPTLGFMNSKLPGSSNASEKPQTVQYFDDEEKKTEAYFEPAMEKEKEVVLVNKKDRNLVFRATIRGSIAIGSEASKCAIVISGDSTVSRYHCKIEETQGKYYLCDGDGKNESTNGTFVNGKKIQEKVLLSEGDVIKMGRGEYVFSIE